MKQDLNDVKQDLHVVAAETVAKQENEDFQKITAWISNAEFTKTHHDNLGRRQSGTGEWLISDPTFNSWVAGKERMLWCSGLPGAGKTTLASSVIDWLQSQEHGTETMVLYLYFSYKQDDTQTPVNMVGGLLNQILRLKGVISDSTRALYNKHHGKGTKGELTELTLLLKQELNPSTTVFVVIDALDECPERDGRRSEFLDEIAKFPENVRTLITSRYSQRIEESFKDVAHIEIRATDGDVKRYIVARIPRERILARHVRSKAALMDKITETVIESSQGMFLLAQLHIDNLAKQLTVRAVQKALHSLPKEIDETYDQAMQRIHSQDEDLVTLAHKALHWITYSHRPLTVGELQQALAVESGDEDLDEDGLLETEQIVSVCAGLVTVDEESSHIRLVHYTTQSYFDRVGTAKLLVEPSLIAETCLIYLSFRPFAEMYCSNKDDLERRRRKYPFLRYAVEYWADHVRDCMGDHVRDRCLMLVRSYITIMSVQQIHQALPFPDDLPDYEMFNNPQFGDLTSLGTAVAFDLVDIVQGLLEQGADVNAKIKNQSTPLHDAAKRGLPQMVSILLKMGADVTAKDRDGASPLHVAAGAGHHSVVLLLLDAGADCNVQVQKWGMKSPLNYAAESGHIEVARILIQRGADVNHKFDYNPTPENGYTTERVGSAPLHSAATTGNEALAHLLMEQGADIFAIDEDGRTTLHRAVWLCSPKTEAKKAEGHVNLARELISRGVGVSAIDTSGETALHVASERGCMAIVEVLLQSNADVLAQDSDGQTAIDSAAAVGHENVVRRLLDHIGRAGEIEKWFLGSTQGDRKGLCRAIYEQDEFGVKSMLEMGVDPDTVFQTGSGQTCLHLAVARGNAQVLQLLLEYGATVNAKDGKNGMTPLHWAAWIGYDSGVKLLLEYHADVEARDQLGVRPLHMAAGFGTVTGARLLLDKGAQMDDVEDLNGGTPLSFVLAGYDHFAYRPDIYIAWEVLGVAEFGERLISSYVWDDERNDEQNDERDTKERLAVLDLLVERGIDLNAPQLDGQETVLQCVMLFPQGQDRGQGRVALLRRLLEIGGFDLEAKSKLGRWPRDKEKETALFRAARRGWTEAVQLLVQYGADVSQGNRFVHHGMESPFRSDVSALHAATTSESICRFLIEAGADMCAVDNEGDTPLHYAVMNGCESIPGIKVLLAHGVDLNPTHGEKKATVLHLAVRDKNIAMVDFLLRNGANISSRDVGGMTVLDIAKEIGHEAMVFFLERYATEHG